MASATLPMAVIEPKKKSNVKYAFMASVASIMHGYNIGVMSGASLYFKKDLEITDVQLEILMGIIYLYSFVGSFPAGWMSDWIGRRHTIACTAGIFIVGALLKGFAVNYAMLMAGQFVAGIGVAYAVTVVPMYNAEISPASDRGFLTSFPETFANLGVLLGYVSNYAFSGLPLYLGSWRVMLGLGGAPSVLLAVMVLGMPESPRWLVMKGRLADAKAVLAKITGTPEEAADRLADIKEAAGIPGNLDGDVVSVPRRRSGQEKQVWKELVLSPTPATRRVLLTALGVHFFQQATGHNIVVLYSPRVFESAGITDDGRLLDHAGRRPLLLCSTGGMVLSLVGLGTGLAVIGLHPDAKVPWAIGLCIASSIVYNAFLSIGIGPVAWVYSSEIFPVQLRALGSALSVACNRVTGGVVTMSFLSLSKAITIGGSFFLYAGVAALAWVFFFAYLLETRGRTLEEMGRLFGVADMGKDAKDSAAEDTVVELPTN
ncbi:hypothetical protein ACP70R_023032 [Stipagrostis hirtigluma subsp. patula]